MLWNELPVTITPSAETYEAHRISRAPWSISEAQEEEVSGSEWEHSQE